MPASEVFGAIANKQHIPVTRAHPGIELAAAASLAGSVDGIPNFPDIAAMLDAVPDLDAVTLCVPPAVRYGIAQAAIARGKHVFLEKPPGRSVAEVYDLARQATGLERRPDPGRGPGVGGADRVAGEQPRRPGGRADRATERDASAGGWRHRLRAELPPLADLVDEAVEHRRRRQHLERR